MAELRVIDASVAAKWFLEDEEDTDLADDLLAGILAGDIDGHVPKIAVYEICHLLTNACKAQTSGNGHRLTLQRAVACVREFFGLPLTTHDISESEGVEALAMAVEFSKTHYDMAYLRLAIQLNCAWCTADEKVMKANRSTFPSSRVQLLSALRS